MLNKYSTIFWDFDGVILNSDEVRTEGFKYIFDSYSKKYTDKLITLEKELRIHVDPEKVDSKAKDKQAEKIEKDMEDKPKEEQTEIRDCAIDPNSTQVAYFYVGDLINVILENIISVKNQTSENLINHLCIF